MKTTQEYFNLSEKELLVDMGDGWTREDCLLLDSTEETNDIWYDTMQDVRLVMEHFRPMYETVEVLECVYGQYAILCRGYIPAINR